MKYVTSVAILAIFVVLGVTLAGMAEINIALAQTPSDNRAPEFILAQPYVEIHTEGYLFDTVIDAYILCYDYPDRISGVGDKLNVNLVHNATSIEYTGPLNGYPNDTFVIRYTCTDMAGHSIVFDQTVDSKFARSFPTYSDTRPPIFEGRGNIHVPPYKVDAFQNGTYKPPSCYDLHESYSHKFHPTGSFASTYDPADIDLSTLGTYEVELTCTDTAGNTSAAKQLVLVIAYVDDFPPENTFVFGFDFETVDIELDDNYPTGNMISFCADYPDPETGLHTGPGNFPAIFSPAVDTSVPGTYQVDWYCEDDAENRSPVFASHTVHVLNSDGDRVDTTAPTLTLVSIESDNANDTTLAISGNTVTLSFTSSEDILEPVVTINGAVSTAVTGSDKTFWVARKTITSADTDGNAVTFTINYSGLASNPGAQVTGTTDGTSVTIDTTAPTLAPVSIESNNTNTSLAKTGDIVTLIFISSEPIEIPDVTINEAAPTTLTESGDTIWSATRTITSADPNGIVMFAISFSDLASNDGIPVTGITAGSSVTVDKTLPPSASQEIDENNLGVTNTGGIKFSIGGLDASTYYEYSTSKCDVADPDDDSCSDFTFAKRSDSNGVLVIIMAGPFTSEQYVFANVKEIGKADPIYHTDFIVQVQNDGIFYFEPVVVITS